MYNQEIEELLNESGESCVSIIIPVHRVSPERSKDELIFHKAFLKAKELDVFNSPNSNTLLNTIESLIAKIDYTHLKDGIGIFASPRVAKIIPFYSPVIEKIKVGNKFDSRDLLYQINNIIDYCVLSISKKHLHLYEGRGEELREIKNEDFPINYVDEYEYAKPSRGTSFSSNTVKEFERDKSNLQELRLIDFLRRADHLIGKYVNNHIPLVVSGGKKEIADYLQVTKYVNRIIGKVSGNYNFNGDLQLANLSWNEVQNHLKKQNQILLANLRELVGKDLVAVGIEDVWRAANEGKGLELIVEKDFEVNSFVSPDGTDLKLDKQNDESKYSYTTDSVERLIHIVREKRGKVIFLDNGEMNNFKSIALRLRYNNLS